MKREQLRAIIDSPLEYDESKEDTIRRWLQDAYGKRMRWVMLCVYVSYLCCLVLAIYSAFAFFSTDDTKYEIVYAVVFLFSSHWIGFVSVFGWVMMQRPRLNREITRLELRIAESIEMIKSLNP